MSRFVNKSASIVEAFRYWVDDMPGWFFEKVVSNHIVLMKSLCLFDNNNGERWLCKAGDYVVLDRENNRIFQRKPEQFEAEYKPDLAGEALEKALIAGNSVTVVLGTLAGDKAFDITSIEEAQEKLPVVIYELWLAWYGLKQAAEMIAR